MMGLGRQDSLDKQIADVKQQIKELTTAQTTTTYIPGVGTSVTNTRAALSENDP
jgi:hypothetical protein